MMQLKITSTDEMTDHGVQPTYGWGENATELCVEGEIRELMIAGGTGRVGIRVNEAGELTITNYGGGMYFQPVAQNVTLEPSRAWNE